MRNNNIINKTISLLNRHYYINIIVLVVVFLFILFRVIPIFTEGQPVSITAERYAIIITIIAIPLSLKFFADRLKKIPRPLEEGKASEKYKSASFVRLYTMSFITMMHILLFSISRNMNFLWFTVVLLIVFLFCKPSYPELESLSETPLGAEGGLGEGTTEPGESHEGRFEETPENPAAVQKNNLENGQVAGK